MSAHTSGPWEWGRNEYAIRSLSFSNQLVVRPKGEFPHGLWVADVGSAYDDERVANARLIAAAPEMLDALQSLVAARGRPKTAASIKAEETAYAAARAAIRKASGE